MILNSPLSKISYQIPFQFPQLYREEAVQMVQLVQSYYEFLESQQNQGIYQARRMLDTIDIDRTMQQMLVFFQKKFLPELPVNEENVRFLVKNITDLYRRKGSEEGLHLFFRMFYETNIEVYYPKNDMLKPSASVWKVGNFIQLYPVTDPLAFNSLIGLKIYGSLSKAEAYVDGMQFVNLYGSSIPILFLDRSRGSFMGLETIYTTEPTRQNFGRIYGSLQAINSVNGITANNKIGDVVDIVSSKGYGGKGIVTDVSDTISGEITFNIVDGDFGYTLSANTVLMVSNQNLSLVNPNLDFIAEERVGQDIGANTWVYGTVIGQNQTTVGVKLDDANSAFVHSELIYTLDRDENISKMVIVAGLAQPDEEAASAEVGELSNVITVDIVTDIIEDYLNVQIGPDTNYNDAPAEQPMSGNTDPINLSTQLLDAFGPQQVQIGTISKLTNIVPGDNYENNIFVLVKENRIMRFDIRDMIIGYNAANTPFVISAGDIITQEREIDNFFGEKVTVPITGKVIDIRNDALYVKPRSFYEFMVPSHLPTPEFGNTDIMIYKEGVSSAPIDVISVSKDTESNPMGYNAIITGTADFEIGRIEAVKVINSGIAYQHNLPVTFRNETRWKRDFELAHDAWEANPVGDEPVYEDFVSLLEGTGVADARGQGITEGRWVSKTSHLNYTDGKRIQDSDFFQDFSYEIASSLADSEFVTELKDLAHPAGVKLFTKFSLLELINIDVAFASELIQQDIT